MVTVTIHNTFLALLVSRLVTYEVERCSFKIVKFRERLRTFVEEAEKSKLHVVRIDSSRLENSTTDI